MVDAVRSIDSKTAEYFDDTRCYADALDFYDVDRYKIFEGNTHRVYSRLDERLKAHILSLEKTV